MRLHLIPRLNNLKEDIFKGKISLSKIKDFSCSDFFQEYLYTNSAEQPYEGRREECKLRV